MGGCISTQIGDSAAVDAQEVHAVPPAQTVTPEIERQTIGKAGANASLQTAFATAIQR